MSNLGQIHFSIEQVTKLLAMQDQLNTYIHPEWKSQNFDWNFAIIDECREIKEHLGWKWWKENYQCGLHEGNRKQVQLEVIDILHFVLSEFAGEHEGVKVVTRWFNQGNELTPSNWNEVVHWMMEECVTDGVDKAEVWSAMAILSGLTTEQVIETYTQKFVLNKFRQDHGYKDGSYVKEWKGWYFYNHCESLQTLEDNEVLEYIVRRLDPDKRSDEDVLYKQLKMYYINRLTD